MQRNATVVMVTAILRKYSSQTLRRQILMLLRWSWTTIVSAPLSDMRVTLSCLIRPFIPWTTMFSTPYIIKIVLNRSMPVVYMDSERNPGISWSSSLSLLLLLWDTMPRTVATNNSHGDGSHRPFHQSSYHDHGCCCGWMWNCQDNEPGVAAVTVATAIVGRVPPRRRGYQCRVRPDQ